jgi:hypothetical protein
MSTKLGHNGGPPMAPRAGGWIAVYRSMRTHPIVGFHLHAKPADPSRGAWQPAVAWLDLLMECNYEDGTINNNGRRMTLRRGQVLGATSYLATRWNWTPKAVRGWLDRLEEDGMIRFDAPSDNQIADVSSRGAGCSEFYGGLRGRSDGRSKGRLANVLTICNYSEYQSPPKQKGQVVGQVAGQVEGQVDPEKGAGSPLYIPARAKQKEQVNKEEIDTPPSPQGGQPSLIEHGAWPDAEQAKPSKYKATEGDALRCFEEWNALALELGLSQVRTLTPQMARAVKARLNEHGPDSWPIALANVRRSAFLQGKTGDRNWRASFYFITQASSYAKVVDGVYGNGAHAEPEKPKQPAPEMAPWLRDALERVRRNGY